MQACVQGDVKFGVLHVCLIALLHMTGNHLELGREIQKLPSVLCLFGEQEMFTSLNSGLRVFFFTVVLYFDFFPISGCKMLRKGEKEDNESPCTIFKSCQASGKHTYTLVKLTGII